MGSGPAVPPAPGINEVLPPHTHGGASSSASTSTAVADSPEMPSKQTATESNGRTAMAKDASHAELGDGKHDHSLENENGGDQNGHDHSDENALDDGGHGHSHGSMNMRGVFLHVLGDA